MKDEKKESTAAAPEDGASCVCVPTGHAMRDEKQDVIVAAKTPIKVELEEGKTYEWCACGLSGNQPFCDYSHFGTSFHGGMTFTADKTGPAMLCRCKHTNNPPYCDGSHTKLK